MENASVYKQSLSLNDNAEKIKHCLSTPENGYLGSSYGCRNKINSYLQKPDDAIAREIISKLKDEIPTLKNSVLKINCDEKYLIINIADENIRIPFNELNS
jgi:hypothetical protein